MCSAYVHARYGHKVTRREDHRLLSFLFTSEYVRGLVATDFYFLIDIFTFFIIFVFEPVSVTNITQFSLYTIGTHAGLKIKISSGDVTYFKK